MNAQHTSTEAGGVIKSFGALRFLFMVMIFSHHFLWDGVECFPAFGDCAVAFFFLLSGFSLSMGYGERVGQPAFSWRRFMWLRAVRLYPMHLLALGLWVVLNGGSRVLCVNALLLQSWFPLPGVYFSGNAVSWFLSDLLFFYAIFPWLYRVLKRVSSLRTLLVGMLALYALLASLLAEAWVPAMLYVFPLTRLVDFVLGILLFEVYRSHQVMEGKEGALLGKTCCELLLAFALVLCLLVYPHLPLRWATAVLWWPVLGAIMLWAARMDARGGWLMRLMARFPKSLGEVSFTFYLLHQMMHYAFNEQLAAWGFQLPVSVNFALQFLLILFMAHVVHYGVERPLGNALRGLPIFGRKVNEKIVERK